VIEKVNARENITSRTIGWSPEADGDLRSERLDAVCRKRQAVAASELKTGERATVNHAPQAARRNRDLAGDKTARSTLALRERQLRRGDRREPGRCRSASGEKQIESISFFALNESARKKANHDD
jgi:hypothetical protein